MAFRSTPPLSLGALVLVCAFAPRGIGAKSPVAGSPAAKSPAAGAPISADALEFFESRIRPVLVESCYSCHSAEARRVRGGLLLDTREGLLSGGDRGPTLSSDADGEPLLLTAIRYEDEDLEMPPRGKLPDRVIADFERWIEMGAPDPRVGSAGDGDPDPATERERSWAFERPRGHQPPDVEDTSWPRGRVDRFVLARIESAGLSPSSPANPRALLRRLSFALRGLPPSRDAVASFERDPSDPAYERLVDRYLADPAFGERFARGWLDVSRYAFDQAHIVGNNESLFLPNAWIYRDWVVGALNVDLPFDRFVRLQLAADLVEDAGEDDLAALGFIGLGPKYYNRNDPRVRADEWEDRVDLVGRGLLGLTVACARCHDHKHDPISAEDYYALAGVFASTEMHNRPLPGIDGKDGKKGKGPGGALHIVREGKAQDVHVQLRGDPDARGPKVKRGFLAALGSGERNTFRSGSGRSELADAIVAQDNPLTARVLVNRVWAWLLGAPIVATPSNFGSMGGEPTHPLLLDDLAVRFLASGASLKRLMREVVLSSTFRQSSVARAESRRLDPANRLLSHAHRRRLSAEEWRDATLHASGELGRAIGGEPIEASDAKATRRTVYARVSRFRLDPFLALFDHPDPNAHASRRAKTTTPLQKLFVLHSPFVIARARALASRVSAVGGEGRIRELYSHVFQRSPTEAELELASEFLDVDGGEGRFELLAHALLASNELLFVD